MYISLHQTKCNRRIGVLIASQNFYYICNLHIYTFIWTAYQKPGIIFTKANALNSFFKGEVMPNISKFSGFSISECKLLYKSETKKIVQIVVTHNLS